MKNSPGSPCPSPEAAASPDSVYPIAHSYADAHPVPHVLHTCPSLGLQGGQWEPYTVFLYSGWDFRLFCLCYQTLLMGSLCAAISHLDSQNRYKGHFSRSSMHR